jgi:hypothetical protein
MQITEQTQHNVSPGILDALSSFASIERVKRDDYETLAKTIEASMTSLATITVAAVLFDLVDSDLGSLAWSVLSTDVLRGH